MITVHHLNSSRSERIVWLLEELGIPYKIKRYQRTKTMQAPPELREIHPLGKSPVIEDGPHKIAESGAIIEYLINAHGHGMGLRPEPGSAEFLRYTYWLHYAEGSPMPPLLVGLLTGVIERSPVPFFVKPVVKEIAKKLREGFVGPQLVAHADFIEGELGKHPFFAGDEFTAADIQMYYPIEASVSRGNMFKDKSKVQAWLKRVKERPAYQRAITAIGEEPDLNQV